MKTNTTKSLTKLLLAGIFIAFAMTACKEDDFTEEDLLRLQNQLLLEKDSLEAAEEAAETARAAAALNEAGELLTYSVMVVSSNNEPVEGAEVTLIAGAQGSDEGTDSSIGKQTLVTDESGMVVFERAVIGGNTVKISAEGYFDVIAIVDFGSLNSNYYTTLPNGEIIPKSVTENSIIPLFQDGSGTDFATIKGRATIQTDLTNDTTEVPQDITIQANLNTTQFSSSGSVPLNIYSFAANQNVGSGQVDNTTGEFEITVPATSDGIGVRFVVPEITADQTLAVERYNGNLLDRPEIMQIPTQFGPNVNESLIDNTIPSFYLEFDEPTGAGAGVDFTLTRDGRSFVTTTFSINSTTPFEPGGSDIVLQVTNRGSSDFENSPQVTIDDAGSGSGAEVEAHIELAINGLTVANAGDYLADVSVPFNLVYDNVFNNGEDTTYNFTPDTNILNVQTNGDGEITADSVNAALAEAMEDEDMWFDAQDPQQIGNWIANLRLVGNGAGTTEAELTVSSASGSVYQIQISDGGSDYTDPSFSFSGGGGSTMPAVQVIEFGTRWVIEVDNSGITTPYNILPSNIDFEYNIVDPNNTFTVQTSDDVRTQGGGFANSDILNVLSVNGTGDLEFSDQVNNYTTDFYSSEKPRVLITEPVTAAAYAQGFNPSINNNGGITNINFFSAADWSLGSGYADRFSVNVVDYVSGSGAEVEVTGGTFQSNGEYNWSGAFNIKSSGTGYTDNVNQQTRQFYNNPLPTPQSFSALTVRPGETYNYVISYGTGERLVDVN